MSADEQQQGARRAQGDVPRAPGPTAAVTVTCPFCHSSDTEPLALFGSQLSTMQHYCRACHTPFERMKQEPERRAAES